MARQFIENTYSCASCAPSVPADQLFPLDGDVVVSRDRRFRSCYTVRQVPAVVQFSVADRDEAVLIARGFGQKQTIDVWYGETGAYRLLGSYRKRTPTLAPAAPMDEGLPKG